MDRHAAVATFAVVLHLVSFASPASAGCEEVEHTTDKCRSAVYIKVLLPNSGFQNVLMGAGKTQIDLPYSTSEIFWYCGSSEERTAWEKMPNAIRLDISFEYDTIDWRIYKCTR